MLAVLIIGIQVFASETTIPAVESVKSFARPSDARFQYSLPDKNKFKKHETKASSTEAPSGEIVLEPSDIKPQKKIIKKLSADTDLNSINNNIDSSTMPMNYESFPQYYDPNSMTQNRLFMPMTGY